VYHIDVLSPSTGTNTIVDCVHLRQHFCNIIILLLWSGKCNSEFWCNMQEWRWKKRVLQLSSEDFSDVGSAEGITGKRWAGIIGEKMMEDDWKLLGLLIYEIIVT